jgi:hypothetical protein
MLDHPLGGLVSTHSRIAPLLGMAISSIEQLDEISPPIGWSAQLGELGLDREMARFRAPR